MVLPTLSRRRGFPMTSPGRPYGSLKRSSSSHIRRFSKFTRHLPNDPVGYLRLVVVSGTVYIFFSNYWKAMKVFDEIDREKEKKEKEKKLGC